MQNTAKVSKYDIFWIFFENLQHLVRRFSQNSEVLKSFLESFLVDLEKRCKMSIHLQRSVPIRPRTSDILPKNWQLPDHFAPSEKPYRTLYRRSTASSPALAGSPLSPVALSSAAFIAQNDARMAFLFFAKCWRILVEHSTKISEMLQKQVCLRMLNSANMCG